MGLVPHHDIREPPDFRVQVGVQIEADRERGVPDRRAHLTQEPEVWLLQAFRHCGPVQGGIDAVPAPCREMSQEALGELFDQAVFYGAAWVSGRAVEEDELVLRVLFDLCNRAAGLQGRASIEARRLIAREPLARFEVGAPRGQRRKAVAFVPETEKGDGWHGVRVCVLA